jgi:hypothetical protein
MLRFLIALYGDRPDTARGRRLVTANLGEIIDGRDLFIIAEWDLITPLDQRAKRLVSAAARRVAVVTAASRAPSSMSSSSCGKAYASSIAWQTSTAADLGRLDSSD